MSRSNQIYHHHSKSTNKCAITQYNAFNNDVTNIGPNLADKNEKATNSYTDYMQNQLPNIIAMQYTTCADILNIIQNIKSTSNTGVDNILTQLKKNFIESTAMPIAGGNL